LKFHTVNQHPVLHTAQPFCGTQDHVNTGATLLPPLLVTCCGIHSRFVRLHAHKYLLLYLLYVL